MKKIIALFMLSVSLMFGAINLQTATKEELMTINGIGSVKADQIIKYRKTNKIKNADDLKNIKGFGDGIVNNVKKNKTTKEKVKKTDSKKVKAKETKSVSKEKTKKEKSTKSIKENTISKKEMLNNK